MNKVKLHVGYIGKTRAGDRVGPANKTGNDYWPFKFDGIYYMENGVSCRGTREDMRPSDDIIGPWEEPAAKVGEWIRSNGGPCPVHPETVVDTYHLATGEPKLTERFIAGHQDWENVIAYRIITPYVEPKKAREFWVHEKSRMSFSSKPNLVDAIHVREVLDDEPADIDGDKPYLFL